MLQQKSSVTRLYFRYSSVILLSRPLPVVLSWRENRPATAWWGAECLQTRSEPWCRSFARTFPELVLFPSVSLDNDKSCTTVIDDSLKPRRTALVGCLSDSNARTQGAALNRKARARNLFKWPVGIYSPWTTCHLNGSNYM